MASRSIARSDRVHPRAALRITLIVISFAFMLPLHGVWRLLRMRSPWPRHFTKVARKISGVSVSVIGQPRRRDVLFVANHVSWVDILLLAGETGSAFVAKADMAPWPVLGWMATLNNSVYVARDQRLDAGAQAAAIKAALETSQPLTLFPEGTTADGRSLLPFRSSLLAAVAPPPHGISIQPVAIDYGADAPEIAWTDDESVGVNALRLIARRKPIAVTLNFMEPVDISLLGDRKAITAYARDAIDSVLFGR
jgi:1-acyl-sn-glycerol-3-phosphate acyltransferase